MHRRWPFTKAEVDSLVQRNKFVTGIPKPTLVENYWVIEAPVYLTSEPQRPVQSLIVCARVIRAVAGIPRALPGVALVWKGHRVRGIDRNTRHDNPDGSRIDGWHEHLWSEKYGDSMVNSTREPKDRDLRGLFRAGLVRWNISVKEEQKELG